MDNTVDLNRLHLEMANINIRMPRALVELGDLNEIACFQSENVDRTWLG